MKIIKENILKNRILYLMVILIILCLIIFRKFIMLKQLYLFNDAGGDTLISYWPHYYNLFSKVQEGKFALWDFNNGIGNTSITRIQELFDPFNFILYFTPADNIAYILGFIAIFKIVLSGLFFYVYLGTFAYRYYTKVIVSILYAFNGYMILWGQHYMFATIIVYIPILLYFYEKWFNEKKYQGFVIMIFLISIFSFYFMYITSIFIFIYASMRYVEEYKFKLKDFGKYFFETFKIYLLGLIMSSFITIPYLDMLTSSPRLGNFWDISPFSLNSMANYLILILRMFGNAIVTEGKLSLDAWWNYYESPILYCGIISLLLIPQILVINDSRKRKTYLGFIIAMIVILILPFCSLIMNGFSATYFRWTYLIITMELYLVAIVLDKVVLEGKLNKKLIEITYTVALLILFLTLIIGYNFMEIHWELNQIKSALRVLIISIMFMTTYFLLLKMTKNNKYKKNVCIIMGLLICIELVVFAEYDINKRDLINSNYIGQYGYYDDSIEAINYIKSVDKTIYRIDKSFVSQSYADSYIQKFYGLRAYDSVNKPEYIDILKTLQVEENIATLPNFIAGCYSRPKLQTLLGVKYILTRVGEEKPEGYTFLKNCNSVNVYINKNFIPLGFTYESGISLAEFKKKNPIIMDDILLQVAVIGDKSNYKNIKLKKIQYNKYENELFLKNIIGQNITILKNKGQNNIEYQSFTDDPNLIFTLDEFSIEAYKALEIEFDVNVQKNQEVQLFWETSNTGFSEENSKKEMLKNGDNKVKLSINNLKDRIIKLRLDVGTSEETVKLKNIKINLIKKENLKDINKYANYLKKDKFVIEKFKEDYIKANISVNKNKILCFSIPYDRGWKVKIDGIDTETEKLNIGLLSVEVKSGNHKVELEYKPPMLNLGILLSISSIIIFIIFNLKCKMKCSLFSKTK